MNNSNATHSPMEFHMDDTARNRGTDTSDTKDFVSNTVDRSQEPRQTHSAPHECKKSDDMTYYNQNISPQEYESLVKKPAKSLDKSKYDGYAEANQNYEMIPRECICSTPFPLLSLSCDQVAMRETHKSLARGVAATQGYLSDRIQKLSQDLLLSLKHEQKVYFLMNIPGSRQFFSKLIEQFKSDVGHVHNLTMIVKEKMIKVSKSANSGSNFAPMGTEPTDNMMCLEVHAEDLSEVTSYACVLVNDEINNSNFDQVCTIVDWIQNTFSPQSVSLVALLAQDDSWKQMNALLKSTFQAGFSYNSQNNLRVVGYGTGQSSEHDDLVESQHLYYVG